MLDVSCASNLFFSFLRSSKIGSVALLQSIVQVDPSSNALVITSLSWVSMTGVSLGSIWSKQFATNCFKESGHCVFASVALGAGAAGCGAGGGAGLLRFVLVGTAVYDAEAG